MTKWKKMAAVGLAATTLAVAFAPEAEARWRRHRGGWGGAGVAAGLVGGALLGAALAPRAAYGAPVYGQPYYGGSYYTEPTYYYAQPVTQCYNELVGYRRSGRPLYQRVCYQQ